ncbi:hypothetical protein HY641_01220 [Candidatus Woesearchaeota archaeon]|nr:hypothetical protein [Candidatus Woesearchaeota archaeon]
MTKKAVAAKETKTAQSPARKASLRKVVYGLSVLAAVLAFFRQAKYAFVVGLIAFALISYMLYGDQ